ncbi:AAA family ATPase [Streptomyces caniscabiei]|uniref:AAA family ATPase n=1 Tax=Streptomyces caniscabiei TaxID=2746961 RepID=UPI0038F8126B
MIDYRNSPAGLVGRDRALVALEDFLITTQRGEGGLAMISGGVGMGKSTLLHAAADRARQEDFIVLRVGGNYSMKGLPLSLANRVLKRALALLEDADGHTSKPSLLELRPALENLESAWDGSPVVSADDFIPFHLVLTRLAERTPILIAIDDVQWSDPESLLWLSTLTPWAEQSPMMLLIAHSTGEQDFDSALVDEVLASRKLEVRLGRLGLDAVDVSVRDVLRVSPEPGLVRACYEATGGNPLFLSTLLEVLVQRSDIAGDILSPQSMTELSTLAACNLMPMVNTRLRRVSPHALPVARALAILDQDADLERVGALAETDTATVASVTGTLSRMGLVRMNGKRLNFGCALLREAVGCNVAVPRFQELQVRAARLVHEAGANDESMAVRLLDTPPIGEPWVVEQLRSAAAAAIESGRVDTAIAYLRRSLNEPLAPAVYGAVLEELGRTEARRDMTAAIRTLGAAAQIAVEPDRRIRLTLEQANLLLLAGRAPDAIALITATECITGDEYLPLVTRLWLSQGTTAPKAFQVLDRFDAARCSDDSLLLSLLALRTCWTGDQREEAAALAFRALALAQYPDNMDACLSALTALLHTGHLEEAHAHGEAMVRWAERSGHLLHLASARSLRSVIRRRQGELKTAVEDARSAVELTVKAGGDCRAGVGLLHMARLVEASVDSGDHDDAVDLLETHNLMGMLPFAHSGTALLSARGRLALAVGKPFEAVRDLRLVGERLTVYREDTTLPSWRPTLATALFETGNADDARRYAREELASAQRWGAPGRLGVARVTLGAVTGGSAGITALEEAVGILTGSPERNALFQTLRQYGHALAADGNMPAARKALRAAIDLAEQCRCGILVTAARNELTAAGGRYRPTAKSGQQALTPTEREVVSLAAGGMTNRDIARRQFVVERTVELHLTNAYRKLGVSGRNELSSAIG